jgi:hypothetical protein
MVLADIACDALELTVSQTTEERHVLESLDRRHRASLTRAESTVPSDFPRLAVHALATSSRPPERHRGLELLLLAKKDPARFDRAALRWHARLCREVDVSLKEAQATLAVLVLLAGQRKGNAAFVLADLLSGRGLERSCEALVAWTRA